MAAVRLQELAEKMVQPAALWGISCLIVSHVESPFSAQPARTGSRDASLRRQTRCFLIACLVSPLKDAKAASLLTSSNFAKMKGQP